MRLFSGYPKNKLQNPDSGIWDLLCFSSILLCIIIFLIQWQQLPFFLDMYYHLAVAKGFEAAGGVAGHNFWEYGPQGAPHLYPPLLHLLILGFLKMGLDGITILRLFGLFMPALLLLTLWYVIKNILTRKTAFFTIFLGLCASLFIISVSFTPAATLGMILILLGIRTIQQKQILSSMLIFGMIFYVHTGIAVIAIVFLSLAVVFKVIETKRFLMIFLLSMLIGSPWLLHIIRNLSDLSYQTIASMPIKLYPVILIFFIIGLYIASKKIKEYKIFIVLFLSLIPMGLLYPFRFLCAQGMVGFLIFAGMGLEKFYSLIDKKIRRNEAARKYTVFFLAVLLLYLIFFAPSIHINGSSINFNLSDSILTSAFEGKERSPDKVLSTGIYNRSFFNLLADYTKRYSEPGEFIWSNYRYLAGILWAMTERPSLSYLLGEIQSKKTPANIHNAGLIIIIDEPKGEFSKIYHKIKKYFEIVGFEKWEDTPLYILINKNKPLVAKYKVPPPLMVSGAAYILLTIYSFFIIISLTVYLK